MNIFFQLALTLFALLVMVGIIGANFKTKVPPLVSQGIGLLIWLAAISGCLFWIWQ